MNLDGEGILGTVNGVEKAHGQEGGKKHSIGIFGEAVSEEWGNAKSDMM